MLFVCCFCFREEVGRVMGSEPLKVQNSSPSTSYLYSLVNFNLLSIFIYILTYPGALSIGFFMAYLRENNYLSPDIFFKSKTELKGRNSVFEY